MSKLVSLVALLAAVIGHGALAEESTTNPSSGFQNFFKKVQDAGSNIDIAKLSAGAIKAQETFGPLISQFKGAAQPVVGDVQKKLADTGLVPTTTANPVGSVLKNLQVVGIGSDIDVGKLQDNAKKAQDTLGPLFSQFSGFINKKSSSSVNSPQQAPPSKSHPLDEFIVEDPAAAAAAVAAPAVTAAPAPPAAVGSPSKSTDFNGALKSLQDAGSKIDVAKLQEGAQKLGSFFSQFNKKPAGAK